MQEQGLIVAMTGDAVNDAAALKQADIGVAMGSGSEVTKQAGRMILTDDNFGTLVNAVEIGRRVYDKIVSYVRYQMTQLLALVMLFVAATVFDVNEGVALTPLMVLYLLVLRHRVGCRDHRARSRRSRRHAPAAPRSEAADHQPHRGDPLDRLRRRAVLRPRSCRSSSGPTSRAPATPSASLTMTFVVMGLGTVFNALTNRRDPGSGLAPPILTALAVALVPVALIVLATKLPSLQHGTAHHVAHRPAVARRDRARARAPDRHRGRQVDPPPARARAEDVRRRSRPSRPHAGSIEMPTAREVNDVAKHHEAHRKDRDDGTRAPRPRR